MSRGLVKLVLFLALAPAAALAAEKQQLNTTQSIMQSIFDPMSRILALSFKDAEFSASKNKAALTPDIAKLAKNVAVLEEHAKTQDRHFEYVAKSLLRDAKRLDRWFARGRYDEARFTLHNMTENCIACHSSFPESRQVPTPEQFFAKVQAKDLGPLERAHFMVMSRRFDDALTEYEKLFSSKELDAQMITLLGSFVDYLKVSISVKSDFKRPMPLIEQLKARATTPLHVRQQLERWLVALKELDKANVFATADVKTARRLIDQGKGMMEFPRDRDGIVYYITADSLLTRFVRARQDRGADVAEAYYLLGTVTPLIEHSFWITRTDFFLETAIRLAPAAPFAPKAYTLLEESLIAGYSGSAGTNVPDDVRALLIELKRVIEHQQGKI